MSESDAVDADKVEQYYVGGDGRITHLIDSDGQSICGCSLGDFTEKFIEENGLDGRMTLEDELDRDALDCVMTVGICDNCTRVYKSRHEKPDRFLEALEEGKRRRQAPNGGEC